MDDAEPTRASFTPEIDGRRGEPFDVHFNPSSLDYVITNTLRQGRGRRAAQHVSQSTGKLSMELLFDTTHNGEDVRLHTEKVAKLMEPAREQGPPPVAHFTWGEYTFAGIVESFRERIDFFSADGVPLRATVSLTLSRQDMVFDSPKNPRTTVGGDLAASEQLVEARIGPRDTVSQLAGRAGDPSAARALAEQNGFESIRSPGAAVVQLSAEVELRAAAAFAGGGSIGLSIGGTLDLGGAAGAGLDLDFGAFAGGALSAGAGAAASAGLGPGESAAGGAGGAGGGLRMEGLSSLDLGTASDGGAPGTGAGGGGLSTHARRLSPSLGQPPAGGSSSSTLHEDIAKLSDQLRTQGSRAAGGERERGAASAGVPASQGAFDALTEGRGFRRHKPLDVESIVRPVELRQYGTGSGVGFRIGGQATMLGAPSVSADVGRNVSLRERIAFDRERGGG
jgi:hypothetical protein